MVYKVGLFALMIAAVMCKPSLLGGEHDHDHAHDHEHAHDHTQDHDHAHDHTQNQDHEHAHDHPHADKLIADDSTTEQDLTSSTTTTSPTKSVKKSDINDGGRLLSLPESDACANRPKQWKGSNGHWYFLSSNVTEYKDVKSDWLDARNLCRKHCMDAISIETEEENIAVLSIMERTKVPYVWTSGRLCNFKGCDTRLDLLPLNVNGWFWSGSGVKLAATNSTPAGWKAQPWSQTGHFKTPQPDNAEFSINETTEACLGVLNNVYKDSITWHDIACYHTKAVICEDSPQLLNFIKATNPATQL